MAQLFTVFLKRHANLFCLFYYFQVPLGCVTPFALINESARYGVLLWLYDWLCLLSLSIMIP